MSTRNLSDSVWQRIRAAYYAFGLGRLPFGDRLARAVREWESQRGMGDSPKPKSAWDAQFSAGSWDYLGRLEESSHYAVIVGYMALLKSRTVLDVGCGEGILYERFKAFGYSRYVGMDISDIAVARLNSYSDEKTLWIQGDGDTYEPDGTFDAIVFNESLYYLREPLQALHRYTRSLNPEGVLIVSNYIGSRRAQSILRDLRQAFAVVDETKVTQGAMSWVCVVVRPVQGAAAST